MGRSGQFRVTTISTRRLRALVHSVKSRGGLGAPDVPPGLREHLLGHVSYFGMVDAGQCQRLLAQVAEL